MFPVGVWPTYWNRAAALPVVWNYRYKGNGLSEIGL